MRCGFSRFLSLVLAVGLMLSMGAVTALAANPNDHHMTSIIYRSDSDMAVAGISFMFNGKQDPIASTEITDLKLYKNDVPVPGVQMEERDTLSFHYEDFDGTELVQTHFAIKFVSTYSDAGEYYATFTFKGKTYTSNEHIIENDDGGSVPDNVVSITGGSYNDLPLGYSSTELPMRNATITNGTDKSVTISGIKNNSPEVIDLEILDENGSIVGEDNVLTIASKTSAVAFRIRPVDGLSVGNHWGYVEWNGITSGFMFTVVDPNEPTPPTPPTPPSGGGNDNESSSSDNIANMPQTSEKLGSTIDALNDPTKELPRDVKKTTTASGDSVTTVPVALFTDAATLSLDLFDTLGNAPANVGLKLTVKNGIFGNAMEVIIPGGFGKITEPGRLAYPMDYIDKNKNSSTMLAAVKGQNVTSMTAKVGGNFTLPVTATVTVSTKLAEGDSVNIYKYDPENNQYIPIGKAVVKGGKLTFATNVMGEMLFTTGTV